MGIPGDAQGVSAASNLGSLIVGYGTELLFDNIKPVLSGAALPIKLAVTDASGADISSPNIAVTATSLVDANGNAVSLKSPGNSNPNNLFRYDPSLGATFSTWTPRVWLPERTRSTTPWGTILPSIP